ncbi:sensor histidine kinase [Halanaeroarchaeum sulfurireducens]|uniref:histidine kinase n=1 Tax=Halanaeroarchaeum sulfurireducens TaxID=1604004 RepID=A0A0N9MWD7_9EURY|nr:PAS domain S-box protein [Halanaeroarchaeum sulfurireducens]ALG81868.1 PAS/PAC sensor signal transduction histidine kinase [Halanaeroarchaeum sulfurireducens]
MPESPRFSSETWSELFDQSGVILLLYDVKTERIADANERACDVLDYDKETLLNTTITDVIGNRDHGSWPEHLPSVPDHQHLGEIELYTANGEPVPVEASVSHVQSTGDEYALVVAQDISERKARETELKRQKERAEQYFETAGNIMLVLNRDKTVARINERGSDLLGYERSELVGSDWFDHVVPEQIEGEIDEIFSACRSDDAEPIEKNTNFIESKEGEKIFVKWHNTALRDQQGNVTGVLSSGIDITERKSYEQELEHLTETLRTIREVNRRLVRAADVETTIADIAEILHNHSSFHCVIIALLDDDQVDFAYESGTALTSAQIRACHSEEYLRSVRKQDLVRIEDVTVPPNQQHFGDEPAHEGVALSIGYDSQTYGVLTIHFTPDKPPTAEETDLLEELTDDMGFMIHGLKLQAERERLAEDLQTSLQQMQVIDRVLRHNFNNEMNVIKGHAETIRETCEGDTAESAATIVEESEQLLTTVNKEREITKLLGEQQSPEPIELGEIIDRVVADFRERYPMAQISVEGPTDRRIRAIGSIEQALTELLTNAVIHSDRVEPSIAVTIQTRDDTVAIRIADDGPGIPAMERKILTEEAEIEPLYHGSGLGLWLVKLIVQNSNGSLTFEENEPRGSIVTMKLPKAAEQN